jgi:ADP-heptose:LPS heptosyltransferase
MGDVADKKIEASRIVVVMPNWLGDGVMATPFLRGLRELYAEARIVAVARGLVAPVCRGVNFVDEVKEYEKGEEAKISGWMRGEKFELGVLLPNSFRSAWMMWRGKVKQRLGYSRGGRSGLLTDRIRAKKRSRESKRREDERLAARAYIGESDLKREPVPLVSIRKSGIVPYRFAVELARENAGKTESVERGFVFMPFAYAPLLAPGYEPVPTIDYYLELLAYLSGDGRRPDADARRMTLGVTGQERAEAEAALRELAILPEDRLVIMVPGANFGGSKCWMPERFAAVAEEVAASAEKGGLGAKVLIASSPSEMGIVEAILGAVKQGGGLNANMSSGAPTPQSMPPRDVPPIVALGKLNGGKGVSVGALKEIVRRARLMICNDTGPRHFAVAFGVPVVTLFGPTDPRWAETFYDKERIVRVDVPCGPCQLKKCPIDHRCMKGITAEMVMRAVRELWH